MDYKTPTELRQLVLNIRDGYEPVLLNDVMYIAVDWLTEMLDPRPSPTESVWIPLGVKERLQLANEKFQVLFKNSGEHSAWDFQLRQVVSKLYSWAVTPGMLIRTPGGLRRLQADGTLIDHDGTFAPNFVRPMLNDNSEDKEIVWNTLVEWVGSEEDAHSLLYHLATSLAPHYSAVKYVLLIGDGRNGKGTLLKMIHALYGRENISSVSRQDMAESKPGVISLNGKLLNLIYDGSSSYLGDSGVEKTLIAGEPVWIKKLYETEQTEVQTNALFVEALNQEPKTRDKGPALQKRLARFFFQNHYELDAAFEKKVLSEPMLGAFLSLLIDHYVVEEERSEKLKLTERSIELQMESVWHGNPVLQFIEHLAKGDVKFLDTLESGNMPVDTFIGSFQPWAQSQKMPERTDGDILMLVKNNFVVDWKAVKVNGKTENKKRLRQVKPETQSFIDHLRKEMTSGTTDPDEGLVGD